MVLLLLACADDPAVEGGITPSGHRVVSRDPYDAFGQYAVRHTLGELETGARCFRSARCGPYREFSFWGAYDGAEYYFDDSGELVAARVRDDVGHDDWYGVALICPEAEALVSPGCVTGPSNPPTFPGYGTLPERPTRDEDLAEGGCLGTATCDIDGVTYDVIAREWRVRVYGPDGAAVSDADPWDRIGSGDPATVWCFVEPRTPSDACGVAP